jgi:3-isopropylmalate/(R)-2-methylmalate dehydratase large subunit
MGMTLTEKILSHSSNSKSVVPGEIVFSNVDKVMIHDVSGPGVIKVFKELEKKGINLEKVWNPDKVWISEDHFVPASDRISADNVIQLTNWAQKYGIKRHYKYGMGQYGICHTISHEEGLILPGEVYVGGDSHTNTTGAVGAFTAGLGHTDIAYVLKHGKIWFKVPETMLFKINGKKPDHIMAKDIILKIISDIGTDGANYKTMQFTGDVVDKLEMEERFTLTNMTTEAGAKNGIIEPDQITADYLSTRNNSPIRLERGDPDATYSEIFEYDCEKMEPSVAKPYSPENVVAVREVPNTEIDKAYIGSCTGAKLSDLRSAARILKGKKVKVRTEVLPAAQSIYMKAIKEGLISIFMESGAVIGPPTCGACCGAHMGVLGKDEICVSTRIETFQDEWVTLPLKLIWLHQLLLLRRLLLEN